MRICQYLFMSCLFMGAFGGAKAQAEMGVANFRQIPAALSGLTGITSKQTEIRSYYLSNLSKFPQLGQLSEVTTPFFLAQLSYSSLYCARFVSREKLRLPQERWALSSVDFGQAINQLEDPARLRALVSDLAIQFWGRGLTSEELSILEEEAKTWVSDPDPIDGRSVLESTLVNLCSTLLSTPAVWGSTP